MFDLPRLQLIAPAWTGQWLTHLWQSTVVALGILLLLAVGRGLTARTRRTLGWLALAKFAVPAAWLAGLAGSFAPAPRQLLTANAPSLPIDLATDVAVEGGRAAAWVAPVWVVPVFSWLWLAGAIALLAWWGTRAIRVRSILMRGARPVGDAVQAEVRVAAERVGLRPVPRCALVDASLSPGAMGILSPVLILPAGLAEKLPRSELAAILIHECVHLRRRDNGWNAVRSLFAAFLWFNPVVWRVNRVIGLETEKSCDEEVLEITGDAEAYASSIVSSVRHALGAVPVGMSAVTTPPVLARVKAILAHGGRRDRPLARWTFITSALALIAFSGRTGSLAADTAPPPRPAAQPPPAVPPTPPATKAPAYQVGAITFLFTSPASVTEQALWEKLPVRRGELFDESVVDQSIRALYRTGWFDLVEVKTRTVNATTFDLLFQVTPKPTMRSAPSGIVFDGLKPANSNESLRERIASADPDERMRLLQEELNRARQIADEANAELKRMRDERALVVAKQKEIAAAEAKANAAANPAPLESTPARRSVLKELLLPAAAVTPPAPDTANMPPGTYKGLRIFELDALDQKPVARFQARPRYPFEMRRNGIGGEVVVDFIVDTDGNVVNARAVRSTREDFEPAAVEAVSKWRFKPGRKNSREVPVHMQLPIVFTINEQ